MSPRLDPRVSWLFAALWAVVMVQGWGGLATQDPTEQLHYPASTAARLGSRSLELAAAIEASPEDVRRFWQRFEATPEEALQNSIAIHDDVIAMLESLEYAPFEPRVLQVPTSLDIARAGLAVLLAEADELAEALEEAERVEGLGDYAGLLTQLYALPVSNDTSEELLTNELALAGVLDSWPRDHLRLRAAQRLGDASELERIASRSEARGHSWFEHTRTLFFANWGLVLLGIGVIAAWLGFGALGRAVPPSPSPPDAPWGLADGLGVLVRGDFFSRLYFVLLGQLPYSVAVSGTGELLYAAGTPLASLPLLWLVHRHLIAPHRASRPDPFGIDPRRVRWGAIAGFTLAAIAAELLGSQAIGWGAYFLDVGSPWTEGFDETLVWASRREMFFTSLDYIVWIPAIEELTFRGLLFFTLRRRMGVLAAAVLSSALFSGVHFYSVTGFLTTFWSGMVWALVFERVRSLIPGVAAHAVYNGLYVASLVLLYR